MRICLFTPTFYPRVGGAELGADLVARGLTARGHEVTVLAQKQRQGPPPPGLPYPVRLYRRLPKQHLWPAAPALWLGRLHRERPLDAVLAFYSYPCGYAAVRWARGRPRPGVVLSPRGADLHAGFHGLRKRGVPEAITAGYRGADRIVSISDSLRRRLEEVAGPGLPPTTVVYNGLDLEEWDAQAAEAEAAHAAGELEPVVEGPFVLHLGRVAPVKRSDLAVEALTRLAPAFRERGLTYLMAGQGELLEPLRARVAERGIGDVVRLPGTIKGLHKSWLFHHARFFCSSSREEGLGNVTLEAMAAGLPMVASDIGPHRELIGTDPSASWGRLWESGNLDACVAALRSMLDEDLAPLRARALAARAGYTRARMIDGYEDALRAAAADASRARPASRRG